MSFERAFVGRKSELALLWERFKASCCGRGGIVLVSGEAGIGKTSLLREMATRAAQAGATVLWGEASAAAGMPPYLPFIEALGSYIRSAPLEQLRMQAGSFAGVLVTILPELGERLGALPPGYPLPPKQSRLRLYEAVGTFLAAIAAETAGGALLILDDLQWADPASLDLLCYIARHQSVARLLLLGAYRRDEPDPLQALEQTLNELARLRALTVVTLERLSPEQIAVLAAGCLEGPVDGVLAQLLYTQSEGNPFFAEELLRYWQEAGLLTAQERGAGPPCWALTAPPPVDLPPTIGGAIRMRLTRLPPPVVELLRVAAIIGRTFSVALLAEVAGKEAEETEDLLLAAGRAGLVHGGEAGAFSFSHDKIRECLYSEVSSARRQRLHERVGMALEAWPGMEPAQRLAGLAFHFSRSSDRARGAAYSRRAAEQALSAHAPQEALLQYRQALDLGGSGDPFRGWLLLGLGEAGLQAGAEEQAAAAFSAAQAWFERAGDALHSAQALRGHGLACRRMGQPALAQECLERALATLEAGQGPVGEVVRTLVDLANLLDVVLCQHEAAIAHGRRALALAQGQEDRRVEAAACRTVGLLLVWANDLAAGIPFLERALTLARAGDDPVEAAEACAGLAQAYAWAGCFERSRKASQEREELARRSQQAYHLGYVYTWLAFLAAARGEWTAAEGLLEQARPPAEHMAGAEPLAFWRQVRGFLAYQRGDYALAEEEMAAAVVFFRQHDPGELLLCLGPLGLTLLAVGKRAATRTCLDEHETLLDAVAAGPLIALSARGCLALAAVAMGDTGRARRHYEALLACRGQYHWFLVDRILGQVALLGQDRVAASAHLSAAESVARREGLRPELGRILAAQSDLALAAGGPGSAIRARRLLGEALAVWQELEVPGEVKRIRQRLRELPRQPGKRPARPLPAGLSRREAEVLRLVAAGKSNREIADELALSESTVARHISSILAKTATANRVEAAGFAHRHGLTRQDPDRE